MKKYKSPKLQCLVKYKASGQYKTLNIYQIKWKSNKFTEMHEFKN